MVNGLSKRGRKFVTPINNGSSAKITLTLNLLEIHVSQMTRKKIKKQKEKEKEKSPPLRSSFSSLLLESPRLAVLLATIFHHVVRSRHESGQEICPLRASSSTEPVMANQSSKNSADLDLGRFARWKSSPH